MHAPAAPLLEPPAVAHPDPATPTRATPPWSIHHLDTIDSTNRFAAHLPAWTAVIANDQTAGRGRYHRPWTSGLGGLWLSAVLPCPGPAARWSLLPLAAGLALLDALAPLKLPDLHLRWPNDLLVESRKLAGILVERHTADTAVVGIGLNLRNRPTDLDPALAYVAAQLADLLPTDAPKSWLDPRAQADRILPALANRHALLASGDTARLADELNAHWSSPSRSIEVTLYHHDATLRGDFLGVTSSGALRLLTANKLRVLEPLDVRFLREI